MIYTYESLLQSRLNYINGKARGFEWKPVKMPYTKMDTPDNGVPETIEKVMALALTLELPVGEWIGDVTKSELDISDIAKDLLLSNIADEAVHYRAFKFASEDYLKNSHYIQEADYIFDEWNNQGYHPLEKAYYAEVGVFLVSLAVMRIFGGETLSTLASNVSRDEMRHVASNGGILADIGYDTSIYNKIENTVNQTLDWLLSDLTVPGLDKSFFMEQSNQLIRNRYAPELEQLTSGADDRSPFEEPNSLLY